MVEICILFVLSRVSRISQMRRSTSSISFLISSSCKILTKIRMTKHNGGVLFHKDELCLLANLHETRSNKVVLVTIVMVFGSYS